MPNPENSPMGALSRIGKRLHKDADKVGLVLQKFDALPNLGSEEGPHRVRAVFTLKPEFEPEPEKDDEFEKMLEEQAKEEQKRREEAAKSGLADLARNLDEGNGIL
jgi:hypothetical protein